MTTKPLSVLARVGKMDLQQKLIWRSPEEIVEIAFQRAPVVMMNEAHRALQRCIRTRQIGQRILPVAHQAGVRHLAMEALNPRFADRAHQTRVVPEYEQGYLSQPEMRSLIQTALDLGWTLVPYEANPFQWLAARHGIRFSDTTDGLQIAMQLEPHKAELLSEEFTNWREEQQALHLITALRALPAGTSLLVWCGNSHHSKRPSSGWVPMGTRFQQNSQINPFVIDQTLTVKIDPCDDFFEKEILSPFAKEFAKYGDTAGLLKEELPSSFARFNFQEMEYDALLFSTQNELE